MPRSTRPIGRRAAYPAAVLAMCYWGLFARPAERSPPDATVAGPPTVEATHELVDRARTLMRAGKYEEALAPVRTLHDTDPHSHIYALQLADIYRVLRNPRDEARYLEEFLRLSPTPVEACPRIGEVYWEQGLAKQSLDAYERCAAFDENDPEAVFYLARAYEWSERYDEAQRGYERGIELDARNLDMHVGLARLELRRGHTAGARTRALSVLHQAAENVDAMLIMGVSFQREGNRREAREYLERGLGITDTSADFHLALGILDEEDNRAEQALRHYSRSIALDARNGDAVVRRDRLEQRMKAGIAP